MLEELQDKVEVWRDEAERRRAELLRAIEAGEVADPISSSIIATVLITAAVSAGTALVTRVLTPRQRFTTGQLQGTLNVPQSEQGIPITEGFGADPGANAEDFKPSHAYSLEDRVVSDGYFYVVTTAGTSGAAAPTFTQTKGATVASGTVTFTCYGRTGGGFKLPMLIVWTSGIRKHVTTSTVSGGGKMGPAPAEQTEISYDLDLAVMPGRGPLRVKRVRANTKTIYQTYQNPTVFYQAEAGGNTKAGGAANVVDALASGGSAVTVPQNGSLQWNGVYGDDTAAVLEFYLKTTAPVTVEMTWVGGAGTTVFNADISSTGGVYRFEYGSAPWILAQGAVNTVKVKNLSATAIVLDRLGVRLSGGPTGVVSGDIDPDEPYTPETPPDPNEPYIVPVARFAGELLEDVDGSLSGVVQSGGSSNISIYPGNTTQAPDPTMEGAVDGQFGAGSTPAFRGRCLIMLRNFYLTEFGGAIPLIQTLAEHQTLDTLEAIYEHWCERVGVLESSDYDFSGVRRVFVRGLPVYPPYSPADVMDELARVYNVYFTESDKLRAYVRGSQAAVAALTSADLGWIDGEEDESEELPGLEAALKTETEIPRRFELTYVDPDRDFDQNSQGTSRQVTESEKTEKMELAVTLYPEEAREVTQRELYEEHVEATTYSGALDWTYLWLNPGDTVTVEEDDGFTHRIFITSLKPNVGVMPFEGFAEETAVYSQPVSTSGGAFEVPPVAIPGMAVALFLDIPLLSDVEFGINEGLGFYAGFVKRRGDGDVPAASLYGDRGLGYEYLQTFEKEATAGVTASTLATSTNFYTETADALTVDLYSDDHALESVTYDDILMGANACVVGNEVCQILTAVRDTSDLDAYPNRWDLVIARRGIRNTDFAASSHATGERFILLNDAIKFVGINKNELNTERDYKMVTSGQSLDDAAVTPFVWTGASRRYPKPQLVKGHRNEAGDVLADWRSAVQGTGGIRTGLTNPAFEEGERYAFYVMSDDGLTEHYRWEVTAGLSPVPAFWLTASEPWPGTVTPSADGSISFAELTVLTGSGGQTFTGGAARSAQVFRGEVRVTMTVDGGSLPVIGLQYLGQDPALSPLPYYLSAPFTGEYRAENDAASAQMLAAGDTLTIWLRDGVVRYFANYVNEASVPFYTSTTAAEDLPFVVVARFGAADPGSLPAEVGQVRILRRDPEAVVTAEMQAAKLGGLKNPLRVKVNRISSVVGEGYSADELI